MLQRKWAAGCLTILSLGCGAPASPVPVRGDIATLAGRWVGQYHSDATGREGSIVFTLRPGQDTARGDVVMIPATRANAPSLAGDPGSSQLLTIAFVQVRAGVVSGQLDPYHDPECGCLVTTVFTGNIKGDALQGTFRTYHQAGERPVEGTWRVERTRPTAASPGVSP